jgi:nitroreductase
MPDAIDLLKIRRSVKPREMSAPGPSPAELETILTIGARVPDHGKLTPWRFIVFEGDARVRAGEVIANVFAQKNPNAAFDEIAVEKRRLTDAPLVIGVVSFTRPHPKVPPWEQELSAGASAMNIVTAATALGYGACWLTGWFAFDREARRLHPYRHANEIKRRPAAPGARGYRDPVLRHVPMADKAAVLTRPAMRAGQT